MTRSCNVVGNFFCGGTPYKFGTREGTIAGTLKIAFYGVVATALLSVAGYYLNEVLFNAGYNPFHIAQHNYFIVNVTATAATAATLLGLTIFASYTYHKIVKNITAEPENNI